MIQKLKRLFSRITPEGVAARELAEVKLSLMAHKRARNYSDALVSFNNAEITRLNLVLSGSEQTSGATGDELSQAERRAGIVKLRNFLDAQTQ